MRRVLVVVLLLGSSVASAQDAGRLIFVRGQALWSQPLGTKEPATQIVAIPDGVTVQAMEANPTGKLIALDLGGKAAWLLDGEWHESTCTGRARPSPGGECLACPIGDAISLVSSTKRELLRSLPPPFGEVNFFGPQVRELAALTDQGIVAFPPMNPARTRVLARPGMRSHFLISPDGGRGVAIWGEKVESRVQTFALDGEGVPRRLGGPGVPTGWSPDSQWVLMQEGILPDEADDDEDGDEEGAWGGWLLAAPPKRRPPPKRKKKPPPPPAAPPRTRACAARAVGGEVKCWNDYEGLGFSPDSALVLLKKGDALFVGKIAGVRPEVPKKLLDGVDGPAVWVP